ncbi:MAG: efflux RND transporter periplasmic adaptor subunit [Spirochaetales bacterium]
MKTYKESYTVSSRCIQNLRMQGVKGVSAIVRMWGAILLLGIISSCGGKDSVSGATVWESPEEAKKTAVEAVQVIKGVPTSIISGAGIVEGIREAWTVSETEGIIREINFRIGQWVEAGQVLVRVDDTLKRLEMERAQVLYESARIEREGTERLFQQGGASASAVSRAKATESGAKAQYELAKKAFEDCTIRSPINGYIALQDPSIGIGSYINRGTRVVRIVDTTSFRLELSVGEAEVGNIRLGSRALIQVPAACPERKIQAEVVAIGAGSDSRTGSYTVVLGWRDSCGGRLRSGMSASVEIQQSVGSPVLLLPSAALVRRGEKVGVFVDKEGKAELRFPALGRRFGSRVEVLSGITEGEIVLISGISRLRPGSPIAPTIMGDSLRWE